MKIDHNKNNRIKLRNFSKSQDKHDCVKTLLVRMLRRRHPNSKKVQIYTETAPESLNEHYPDVCIIFPKKTKNKGVYGRSERFETVGV